MPHGGMQLVFSMWVQDSDGPMHAMDTRHERQLSKNMYPIHLPTLAAFNWHPVLFPGRPITHRRNLPRFVVSTTRHVPHSVVQHEEPCNCRPLHWQPAFEIYM